MKKNFFYALLFLGLLIGFQSCVKNEPIDDSPLVSDYSHKLIKEWNDVFVEVERFAEGFRPCPAPRVMAYVGIANYEACISGMPQHNSLAHLYPGLVIPNVNPDLTYHWPTVINTINAYLYLRFFENDLDKIHNKREQWNEVFIAELPHDEYERSVAHGERVAEAVWSWASTDTWGHYAHRDPFGEYDWREYYNGPGSWLDWKNTEEGTTQGLFNFWGKARTFVLKGDEKVCRPPSAEYSESVQSSYYAQALEVYSQNTPTLSYEGQWIAEFWSDDLLDVTFSPPSRWLNIASQVYALENTDLETALYTNVLVGIALNEAAVGCWNSKYVYNVERPATFINRLIDPTWKTNLRNPYTGEESLTPSFPAYPSGHSTFGAAAAEVLAGVFGYSYSMTDYSHVNRTEFEGKPRSFGSFREMADENAWSRIPLGVHWRMDSDEGVRFGTEIGRKVANLDWKK